MSLKLEHGVYSAGVSLLLAGGGAVAVAEPYTNPWYIGWLSLVIGVALLVWGVKWNGKHLWQMLADDRPPMIPIAFEGLKTSSFKNFAMTGRASTEGGFQDPQCWDFGIVTIASTSATRAVNLEVRLRLKSNDGWSTSLAASPQDDYGRRLDKHGAGEKMLKKHGFDQPPYLENPIHIRPNEAATGRLVFLLTPFDEERRIAVVQKYCGPGDPLNQSLLVKDLISGIQVELPVPASYRGRD